MTPIRLVRMAWAGTSGALAAGFVYLAYSPVPGSHAADRVLTLAISFAGALFGALLEIRLTKLAAQRRSAGRRFEPVLDAQAGRVTAGSG